MIRAGVLWNQIDSIRGSQPSSRYGDSNSRILPSVLPATHLLMRVVKGFTDLSRLMDGVATAPGNVTYPTRNFARFLSSVSRGVGLYLKCTTVHLFCDGSNLFNTIFAQMSSIFH